MGVHDYICFIQQNGQCLAPLELVDPEEDEFGDPYCTGPSGTGCNECTVVVVPDNINIDQLEYRQFADYRALKLEEYSAGDWDFRDLQGYRKFLMNGWDDAKDAENGKVKYPGIKNTNNYAIWRHDKYPGHNLVNFHPVAYQIFVSYENTPQELSYDSYRAILSERGIISYSEDKRLLHNLVIGSRVIEPYKIEPLESLPNNGLQYIAKRCSSLLSIIAQYAMPEEWLYEQKGVSSDMLIWLRKEGIITKEQRTDSKFSVALCDSDLDIVKELFTYWNLDMNTILEHLYTFQLETLTMIRQQRPVECKAAINRPTGISLPGNVKCLKELVDNWGLTISQENLYRVNKNSRHVDLQNVNLEALQYIRKRFNIKPPNDPIMGWWVERAVIKLIDNKDKVLYQELCDYWGLTLNSDIVKSSLTTAIIKENVSNVQFLMSLGMTVAHITSGNSYAINNLAQNGRGEAMIKLLAQYGLNRSHVVESRSYAVRYGRNNIVEALDELPPGLILVIS